MKPRASAPAYGIDFGTSNSAVAVLRDGVPEVVPVGAEGRPTIPSILWFAPESDQYLIGEEAIAGYLDSGMQGRLMQSIKSLLTLAGTHYGDLGEELIASFLKELKSRADKLTGMVTDVAVIGRPAKFSEDAAEDRLSQNKLLSAARQAGFSNCTLLPEPVAAARSFRSEVKPGELLFVADLGGGTSDFTLLRMAGKAGDEEQILGTSGVYTGGDELDSALMRKRLGKLFGEGSHFKRDAGQELPFPRYLLEMLSKPHLVPKLLRTRVFEMPLLEFLAYVKPLSDSRKAMVNFHTLLKQNLSYAMFSSIEQAKRKLSEEDSAEIRMEHRPLRIAEELSRAELDRIVEPHVQKIWNCAQSLLDQTNTRPADVARVLMTGGTSFVPIIFERFQQHFRAEKVVRKNAFLSVVEGLALSTASQATLLETKGS